jgi:flagella basal body P-ring formation protein FlgA
LKETAIMSRTFLLAACALCASLQPAPAATLRAFRELPGSAVRLSDLFAGLAAQDRVLGASPAPGARIQLRAPQLAAIARDYGVDWRPVSGAEETVLERQATPFARAALLQLLRAKLTEAGAPADAAISLPGYTPPLLPVGAVPQAELADFTYDAAALHFTATLNVTVQDAPPDTIQIAGQIMPMVDATLLTHRLRAGSVLTQDDIRTAQIPVSALHGDVALGATAIVGLALRRETPAGQALVAGDLLHPTLVTRNAPVRMELSAGAIALAAEGLALEDGAMGAHIRVQNPTSHAVMLAEVTGPDAVRIMAGHGPLVVAAQ